MFQDLFAKRISIDAKCVGHGGNRLNRYIVAQTVTSWTNNKETEMALRMIGTAKDIMQLGCILFVGFVILCIAGIWIGAYLGSLIQ